MTKKTCREVTLEIVEKCTRWLGNELSQLLLEHADRIDAIEVQFDPLEIAKRCFMRDLEDIFQRLRVIEKALETPTEPATVAEQKAEEEEVFYRWNFTEDRFYTWQWIGFMGDEKFCYNKEGKLLEGYITDWDREIIEQRPQTFTLEPTIPEPIRMQREKAKTTQTLKNLQAFETQSRENMKHDKRVAKQSAVGDAGEPHTPSPATSRDTPTAAFFGMGIEGGGPKVMSEAEQLAELRATVATLRNRLSEWERISNKRESAFNELQEENERLKSRVIDLEHTATYAMCEKMINQRDEALLKVGELQSLEAAAMLRESEAWRHVHALKAKIAGLEPQAAELREQIEKIGKAVESKFNCAPVSHVDGRTNKASVYIDWMQARVGEIKEIINPRRWKEGRQ